MKRAFSCDKKMIVSSLVILSLLSLAGGQTAAGAEGPVVFVLKSKSITSYNLAAEGFRQNLPSDWQMREAELGRTAEEDAKAMADLKAVRPDAVLAVGGKALSALIAARVDFPVVFCMVINPEQYDWSGINATGVFFAVSLEKQLEVLTGLQPKITRVGALCRSQRKASLLAAVLPAAKSRGVEIVAIDFAEEKEIPKKLREAVGKINAVWMLDDAYINSEETLRFVILTTLENSLPFMAVSDLFVKEGALVSLSPSFYGNGRQAGELVRKVVNENIRARDLPVQFHREPDLIINQKIAQKLGISIPPQLLEQAKKVYE